MLINSSELRRLSLCDSQCFDKEGYLFVKERTDRLFNQWKSESFIERFCRLKGNLLLIIATKTINDFIDSDGVNDSEDRFVHLLVLEEFAIKLIDESSKHFEFIIEFNKNESIRCFHFATISHNERDQWIQSIHLSSFAYLRSLYQTLVNQLKQSNHLTFDDIIDDNLDSSHSITFDSSVILSISCDHIFLNDCHFEPKLVVFVYYKTLTKCWLYLGKTETSISRIPYFNKCLTFPKTIHKNCWIQLKFNVYKVVETLTSTKCLLAETYLKLEKLYDNKKEDFHKLELRSLVNNQVIGILAIKLSHCLRNSEQNLRKVSSLHSITDYNNNNNNNNNSDIIDKKAIKHSLIRSHSVPNIGFDSFDKMSNFDHILDSKLFTNTFHKSFQFSIPKQNTITFIDEFMSDSGLAFSFPQVFMNIFMNDEKKLMNCITYSIGEVLTEWQRSQMRALESHLRLVNVLTESLNEISHYQMQNSFRPSTTKNDPFLQFIPLNFHLQQCLVNDSDSNRKLSYDIYTVGAYCCHYLGFESGGIKYDLFDSKNSSNNQQLRQTWNAMKNYFSITSLRDRIDFHLKALIDSLNETFDINLVFEHFNKVDDLCKQIVCILSSKQVDESLAFCESVRRSETLNSSSISYNNIASSFERTLSLEETRNTKDFDSKELKRHKSLPTEEQQEFEPIDLTHLNIKASLISINSKLSNKNNALNRNDLDPSRRKLKNAINSLCRTSSVCYASAAIKLDREQIELFYTLRLRRDMIFTQGLTTLIIAIMSQLKSKSFLQKVIETRSILVQHEVLLSCYAEELGMLEDLAFCMQDINNCVKFIFEASVDPSLQPRIEGNSFNLRVIFSVPNFPSSLKSIECSLTSVIFNVGINETATLAETFGYVKLQESINKESYAKLEAYINRIFVDDVFVLTNMNALKSEIWSNRAKNVRIFHLAEQIVQSVNGIRFSCCKSGKDRTSMAVTLEEARLCFKLLNISEINEMQLFQNIVDTLRSEGTRRENTRKNVGIAKYAFNSLQLLTFPKLYRAPHSTYSSIET